MLKRNEVEDIKRIYQVGMRVRLLKMDDFQAPPIGTEGTVCGVDDAGNVRILWDIGSYLSSVMGEDEIEIISR